MTINVPGTFIFQTVRRKAHNFNHGMNAVDEPVLPGQTLQKFIILCRDVFGNRNQHRKGMEKRKSVSALILFSFSFALHIPVDTDNKPTAAQD